MKRNMGSLDQKIRLGLSVVIVILFFAEIITGATALIALILMGILLTTSFFQVCPLYCPFKINTTKKDDKEKKV